MTNKAAVNYCFGNLEWTIKIATTNTLRVKFGVENKKYYCVWESMILIRQYKTRIAFTESPPSNDRYTVTDEDLIQWQCCHLILVVNCYSIYIVNSCMVKSILIYNLYIVILRMYKSWLNYWKKCQSCAIKNYKIFKQEKYKFLLIVFWFLQ